MYTEIKNCRICECKDLVEILNLGNQALTGIFPKKGQEVPVSPLVLVRCENPICNLVQLKHTYNLFEMYGNNYGYRSGLNSSMVNHLKTIIHYNWPFIKDNDLIIDIGANDGTLLSFFPAFCRKIAIDPTIKKFKKYYSENIETIEDFFPSEELTKILDNKKAKIITSIACFYDLENPVEFAKNIKKILDKEGIWITEQSYLPSMVRNMAYDTICHEHLEYYGLKQLKIIAEKTELKIIDVEFNNINGGSFQVTFAKKESSFQENKELIENILYFEESWNTIETFKKFKKNVEKHRSEIQRLFNNFHRTKIYGYGASTKGNVLLQYCGITQKEIKAIVEINEDKFNCYTPGTNIPIIPEKKIKDSAYFFVLPWHFKENILKKNPHLDFIFPLPDIEFVFSEEKEEVT